MEFEFLKVIIEIELGCKIEIKERFSGGMSNYTFLIEKDEELFTYRIPGKNASKLIDRTDEASNLELIKPLGLNCENVSVNVSNGHKLAKYIEGNDLTKGRVDYNEVASKLRLLHNSGIKAVNDYDKIAKLNYYETLVRLSFVDEYYVLRDKVKQELEKYAHEELVFCHGDAQRANWLMADKLYLLDWEYAGNNDPYYDIACFGNSNFNDAIRLLKHYLDRKPNNYEMSRLITNRMFQCLQWHVIATYKEQCGLSKELNISFKKVAANYLVLVKGFMDMLSEYK